MKTYVITLSKTFPSWHPRRGDLTCFASHLRISKIHTIRANYPFWEKRIKEIQAGRAVLSIRQWTGKPYASKQEEIARLTSEYGVGIQRLYIYNIDGVYRYCVWDEGKYPYGVDPCELARKDGLSFVDWRDWFKDYDITQPLAIIHFTKFRY